MWLYYILVALGILVIGCKLETLINPFEVKKYTKESNTECMYSLNVCYKICSVGHSGWLALILDLNLCL